MIRNLQNEIWSRMRGQLRRATSSDQLQIMKIGGETERVVTLFVFEPGESSPSFCVKTIRRLEDAGLLRSEADRFPGDGRGAPALIDIEGLPTLVIGLRSGPIGTP